MDTPDRVPGVDNTPLPTGWYLSTNGLADAERQVTSEDQMPAIVRPIRPVLLFAGVLVLVLSLAVLAVVALS